MAKTTQKPQTKKVTKTTSKPASKSTGTTKKSSAKTGTAEKRTASKASAKKAEKPASKSAAAKKTAPAKKPASSKAQPKKTLLDTQIEQSNKELYALLSSIRQEAAPEKPEPAPKSKTPFIVAALAAVIVVLILIFSIRSCSSASHSPEKERQNTIVLAKKYMDKGQYESAMELLNKLLIENADDKEIEELLDQLIELKKQKDAQSGVTVINGSGSGPGSYDINIDTSSFTDALNKANERNQEVLNKLLEAQRQDEQERQSQAKAQEQQRKAEEAKRKAEEEELAKQNKKNAEKIAKINDLITQANASLNTGKNAEAIKKYQEALKLLPIEQGEPKFSASKFSEIASNLYDAAEREKSASERTALMTNAVTYAQKAIEKDPGNAKAHFILAMNAEQNNNAELAEKELELAVKNDPSNYIYYYYLGRRQQLNKKYSQARASYTSAIKINPNFDSAHFNLGITCNRLNLSKDALSAFRKAYTVNPQHSKAYLEEARLLSRVFKDYDGATASYNKVLSIEPDNMNALKECGSVYAESGNYAKAESYFRRALAKLGTTQDPMTYYNLSTVLYNQNKAEEAVKYAKEAYDTKDSLRSNTEKAMVVYNYALITEKSGNQNDAIPLYKEVLTLNPNHTKSKTNLGIMFMEMNPPDANMALQFLESAYQEDKKSFEVSNNLGNAYLLKKDYSKAINCYLNASRLKPKDVTVKENLAKAYAEAGQNDNAKETYKEVLNMNPQNYDAYIEIAKVCIALKDTISAEGYLTALQNKKPEYRISEVKALLEAVKN